MGAGPFHSQNVESWFTSVAGLKVVAPSNPYDAKGLLIAAFEDAASLGQAAFEWLDAPVVRLGALDTPVPFSKTLEEAFSPKGKVLPALRDLLAY
jgi:pyruvate/2-oxoglutarate/acetoin dehydrogenase E1 component